MDPAFAQPYAHLAQMLSLFSASLRSSQPPASSGWSRATTHLEQELRQLQSFAPPPQTAPHPPNHAALRATAIRLTQLARTLDGLRLEQSITTPPAQLADQQRLVVFAAWQLLQTLEHSAALEPSAATK